jgi:hypothetical protein
MGWTDPANWDFVEYSKTLKVWNAREKEAADAAKQDGDVEDLSDGDTMPPSIEWMMADDARLSHRGYEVN